MFTNDSEKEQAKHAIIGISMGILSYTVLGTPFLLAVLIPFLYWGGVIIYEVWRNSQPPPGSQNE